MSFGFILFDYAAFERAFQAFVQRGGLDETHVVGEDFERARLRDTTRPPERCPHGLTRLTCSHCYLSGWRGEDRGL